MKTIKQDDLKRRVAEKGLTVTRGKKPKKERLEKPNNQSSPTSELHGKLAYMSVQTVCQIAEELKETTREVNKLVKSLEEMIKNIQPPQATVKIVKPDEKNLDCDYDIIRDHGGNMTGVKKRYVNERNTDN
jgi:hypothetical protein